MSESLVPAEHLIVFTGVVHHTVEGRIVAHGGFVREIDVWARIFEHVTVVAPYSSGSAKKDEIPYRDSSVELHSLGGPVETTGVLGKLRLLPISLNWLFRARSCIGPNSVIMARGPDSTGFLGVVFTRWGSHKRFAKYADQWTPYPNEPLGYKVQRAVYRSRYFGGPVFVNTAPDPSRPHVISLLNVSMSRADWVEAASLITNRRFDPPFRLLFVGRISIFKGLDVLLHAVRRVLDDGFDVIFDVVGDGEERLASEKLAAELGLKERVTFHGWLGRESIASYLVDSFCMVHGSKRQGLDKVLLEAMTYALPVVATDISVSRLLIDPPRCGLVVPPNNMLAMAQAIEQLLVNPTDAQRMGLEGRARVADLVWEEQEVRYRRIMREHMGLATETS